MIDACEHAGIKLMTAFPMRFSPTLAQVRSQYQAGVFGEIYCFNATNQGQLHAHIRPWFVDKKLAGGGAFTDHIVQLADVFRWYLDSEIMEVYAQMNRILHADTVEVETGGQAMLTFANGVFATIDCSWSKPPYYPTWAAWLRARQQPRGCKRRGIQVKPCRLQPHPPASCVELLGGNADRAMLEDFVAVVRDDRVPGVTGTDGLRAAEAVAAAYESVRVGQPVRL